MNQLQTYKLILAIAAIFFIAKPFVGFGVYSALHESPHETNVLVKVFAKRKPEFMEEVAAKSVVFQTLLRNKAREFAFTINALLACLYSLFAILSISTVNRFLRSQRYFRTSAEPIYLLTRQFTI
ncbi:hypothetical protein [Mucilaginibacter sp. CSA2-8R]|uniref:hypothetical protein n=1 Tax=Mucilaginibacter sp. CSA2-8R TaxID=3141542 RepID=UPI00315D83BA